MMHKLKGPKSTSTKCVIVSSVVIIGRIVLKGPFLPNGQSCGGLYVKEFPDILKCSRKVWCVLVCRHRAREKRGKA